MGQSSDPCLDSSTFLRAPLTSTRGLFVYVLLPFPGFAVVRRGPRIFCTPRGRHLFFLRARTPPRQVAQDVAGAAGLPDFNRSQDEAPVPLGVTKDPRSNSAKRGSAKRGEDGDGCGSKVGTQNATLVNGTSLSGLILTHTHMEAEACGFYAFSFLRRVLFLFLFEEPT